MIEEELFRLEREAEQRVREAHDREIDLGGPGSSRRASEAMDAPMLEAAAIRKMRQRFGDLRVEISHQENFLRKTHKQSGLRPEVLRRRRRQAEAKLASLRSQFQALESEATQRWPIGTSPEQLERRARDAEGLAGGALHRLKRDIAVSPALTGARKAQLNALADAAHAGRLSPRGAPLSELPGMKPTPGGAINRSLRKRAITADNATEGTSMPQSPVPYILAREGNSHSNEADESAVRTLAQERTHIRKARSRRQTEYRLRDLDDPDTGENLPVVNKSYDREAYIRAGWPAWFGIKDDTKDSGDPPWYAIDSLGTAAVKEFDHLIEAEAKKAGVNPNFVRAIVFIENSHGYYDVLASKPETVRPMNINPEKWGSLGLTRETAQDPEANIRAGTRLLKEIWNRIDDPTPRKVAALWQFIGAEHTNNAAVRNYVARVERLMKEKPWQAPPTGPMSDPSAIP